MGDTTVDTGTDITIKCELDLQKGVRATKCSADAWLPGVCSNCKDCWYAEGVNQIRFNLFKTHRERKRGLCPTFPCTY